MIDLTKPVQTRSGLPARVASTKLDGTFPVLAIVEMPDGIEVAHQYTAKGAFMSYPGESQLDLVNVQPPMEEHVAYVNLGQSFGSKLDAQREAEEWPVMRVKLRTRVSKDTEFVWTDTELLEAEVLDA